MNKKPTVLILAYDFPPYVSVGALRPHAWLKYFKDFDLDPVVVTRQWSNEHGNELDYISPSASEATIEDYSESGIVLKTPYFPNLSNRLLLKHGRSKYRLLRKAITAWYEVVQFLRPVGPKKELYKTAREYLADNKINCIVATGEPFVLFHYASKLSDEFNIPWIADYRDPWTLSKWRSKNPLFKIWNGTLERLTLKNCSHIVTPNSSFIDSIKAYSGSTPIDISKNGFDLEVVKDLEEIKQEDKELTISMAGLLYDYHPIDSVLHALSGFSEKKFQLRFYGLPRKDFFESDWSARYPELKDKIKFFPKMEYVDLMQNLAKSNVLLLFNYYNNTGTKIYDYLAAKRKILFCYTNDSEANHLREKHFPNQILEDHFEGMQEKILRTTEAGILVENKEQLSSFLSDLFDEFEQKHSISCATKNIEQFSRKHGVGDLAKIIHSVAQQNNS